MMERSEMLEETGELSGMICYSIYSSQLFDARFKLLLQIRKFLMQENGNAKA